MARLGQGRGMARLGQERGLERRGRVDKARERRGG